VQLQLTVNELVRQALCTDHARFALQAGRALAYPPDVGPFAVLTEDTTDAWRDLATMSQAAFVARTDPAEPDGWKRTAGMVLTTMVATEHSPVSGEHGLAVMTELTAQDVPAMLRLTGAVELHTFFAGSLRIAEYFGYFDGDRLVGMAGLRFMTPSWREVCCVATDPGYRGRGYATGLLHEAMRRAGATGRTPVLNVELGNDAAIRLYGRLGFTTTGADWVEHLVRESAE
jgi:ribosomal protein S18 acetylase RimI-like enzyme